ncbi:MAG: polysaccharide deacetylase family protein [Solirubrobacterales bacterium]
MSRAVHTAVGAGVGAAGFAWFHGQYPTSQLYGRTICRVPGADRMISLTYDDGPNPRWTEPLMEVLARHGAHATFLTIGKWAEREPDLLRALSAAGHAFGNHTWSHPTMPLRSRTQIHEELRRCREAVEAAGVEFSTVDGAALMRPPYGRRRPGTLRAIREAGYNPFLWSITCYDWRRTATVDKLVSRAGRARGGDVILLHDGSHTEPAADRSASVAATDEVLGRLTAEGYRFVTVPELVGETPDAAAGDSV